MNNYTVQFIFNSGSGDVILPLVFSISDPKEGEKSTIISGTRGDGSIVIPGGKKSQIITIKGYLVNHGGYEDLIADKLDLQSDITTNVATLTVKHYTGSIWQTDYSYTVKRIGEITYTESLRTDYIEYSVEFLVLSY